MDSNSRYQKQQHQPNSGLLRFRSAPCSVLSNLAQGYSEPERLALRFLNSCDDGASPSLREFEDNPSDNNNNNKAHNESTSTASSSSPSLGLMNNSHQGYLPSRFMRQSSTSRSSMDFSFGLVGSVGMDLPRQSSFPAAGYFSSSISFQNGYDYDTMKGVGNCGGVNGNDGELGLSMNRLNNQINLSSSSSANSSLGMLSQISKLGSEGSGATNHDDDGRQGCSNGDARFYGQSFPYGSDAQNGEIAGNQVHTLSHHMSFPKASTEMFAMANMIQFPDSVPCKIRAKRGCATHPRSIAERVRRTRISERIRKLQELVPNMDRQTSTADMLDLAVGYIKDLQKQFKHLSEKRAKCKCISMQKSDSNRTA